MAYAGGGWVRALTTAAAGMVALLMLLTISAAQDDDLHSPVLSGVELQKIPKLARQLLPVINDVLDRQCPELPAVWVIAEIQAESGWNPRAHSNDSNGGASGLYQMNDRNWAVAGGARSEITVPETHLRVGIPWVCTNLRAVTGHLKSSGKPTDPLDAMLVCHIAGCGRVTGSATGVPTVGEAGCAATCVSLINRYIRNVHRYVEEYRTPPVRPPLTPAGPPPLTPSGPPPLTPAGPPAVQAAGPPSPVAQARPAGAAGPVAPVPAGVAGPVAAGVAGPVGPVPAAVAGPVGTVPAEVAGPLEPVPAAPAGSDVPAAVGGPAAIGRPGGIMITLGGITSAVPAAPAPFAGGLAGCRSSDPTSSGCLTAATRYGLDALVNAFGALRAGPTLRAAGCWDRHAWNPGSDHAKGKACDLFPGQAGRFAQGEALMEGWRVANWYRTNADALHVKYLIWQGRYWQVGARDVGDGWGTRYDGGGVYNPRSATGGHYDHVHVSYRD